MSNYFCLISNSWGNLSNNVGALSRNPFKQNFLDEIEKEQPARLLLLLPKQENKRVENSSKPSLKTSISKSRDKPLILTRKGLTSKIEPAKSLFWKN